MEKRVRHAGAAPAPPVWKTEVLLLHQWRMRKMALPRGLAPRASAFAGRRAQTLTLRERMKKWWLRPVLHRTLLVFSEALIYLSYTAIVPPRRFAGNAEPL